MVAVAATGEEGVELFQECHPDVTLMDLQLPNMSGLDAIRAIRHADANARVIVLTVYQGDEDIFRALQAGAATYLLKDALSDDLTRMIREVHAGSRSIPPNVRALLSVRNEHPVLSSREVEVLQLVSNGMRNREVALTLGITEGTAKVHVKNILAKLGVSDRSAAITVALSRGIIHLSKHIR